MDLGEVTQTPKDNHYYIFSLIMWMLDLNPSITVPELGNLQKLKSQLGTTGEFQEKGGKMQVIRRGNGKSGTGRVTQAEEWETMQECLQERITNTEDLWKDHVEIYSVEAS